MLPMKLVMMETMLLMMDVMLLAHLKLLVTLFVQKMVIS
jgi:hypothetical protein